MTGAYHSVAISLVMFCCMGHVSRPSLCLGCSSTNIRAEKENCVQLLVKLSHTARAYYIEEACSRDKQ